MPDGNFPETAHAYNPASYLLHEIAEVSIDTVLAHLIAPEDQRLLADITAIVNELKKPVIITGAYNPDVFAQTKFLNELYAKDQALRAREHAVFDGVIQKYKDDEDALIKIQEYVIRIGQIVKVASSATHDNVSDDMRLDLRQAYADYENGTGSVEEIKNAIPLSVDSGILKLIELGVNTWPKMCAAIKLPVVSSVSSSHPTRYLTTLLTDKRLAFALSNREMTRRYRMGDVRPLQEYMAGRGEAFEALKELMQAPITFKNEKDEVANLTPLGEILAMVGDVSDDFERQISEMYRTYDDALQRLADAGLLPFEYGEQERSELKLSLEFATWVMGDKDGNNNIRSEHLMLAPLLLRQRGAKLYGQALSKSGLGLIREDGTTWQAYFDAKHDEMSHMVEPLLARIAASGGIDLPMKREEYLNALAAMRKTYGDINAENLKFQEQLEQVRKTGTPAQQKAALGLRRKSEIFGFGLLTFHLRETAEMYEPVLATLLSQPSALYDEKIDYAAMKGKKEEKLALINAILEKAKTNPEALAKLKDDFFAGLKAQGKDNDQMRAYRDKDGKVVPEVITLHTLQRFELGAIQKGLISDHILAECKGALEMIETLLVSKITGVPMTIAPLLEELDTLKNATPIFKEAFEHRAWRDHMWEMAGGDPTKLINLLKVQFAHSDNMRLSGFAMSRGTITTEANLLAPGMEEAFPRILELYIQDGAVFVDEYGNKKGLEQSDVPRILQRMEDNPIAYCIRQFHGGSACDTARGGVRSAIPFAADMGMHEYDQKTQQGGDNSEVRLMERFKRIGTTQVMQAALALELKKQGKGSTFNIEREMKHCDAIFNSVKDYNDNHFGDANQLGSVMGEVGFYRENFAYCNPGSRGARTGAGGITAVYPDTSPVTPQQMRTIGFTTTGVDMGVGFAVLPMRNMQIYFNNLYRDDVMLRAELQADAGTSGSVFEKGKLTPLGLQTLYRVSPVYRAAVSDFPAFGAAISNIPLTIKLLQQRVSRGAPEVTAASMEYFMTSVPKDVVGAAVPYLYARGLTIPEKYISKNELKNPTPEICAKLGLLIRKGTMQHIDEQLGMTERVHNYNRLMREHLFATAIQKPGVPYSAKAGYSWRLCGTGRGVYGHQVFDGAADPHTGRTRVARAHIPAVLAA